MATSARYRGESRYKTWGRLFSPLSLFAGGEQGVWFDPSDLSTMFQDSAGTTPVTGVGQPVGLIRDKSGRGNHASQATTTMRPLLQQDGNGNFYLSFDGVDDGLVTAALNFSSTDKMTIVAGITDLSDAVFGMIAEFGVDSQPGTWYLGRTTLGEFNLARRASVAAQYTLTSAFPAPTSKVATAGFDFAASTEVTAQRVNGVASGSVGAADAGSGTFLTYTLSVGRRTAATSPFTGSIYGILVRGAASSAAQIAQAERFIGAKMGIAL